MTNSNHPPSNWYSSTETTPTERVTRWYRTKQGHICLTVQVPGFSLDKTSVEIVTGTLDRTYTITHVDGYETSTLKVPLPAQVGKPVSDASLKDWLLMQNFEPRPEQDPVAVKVVAR